MDRFVRAASRHGVRRLVTAALVTGLLSAYAGAVSMGAGAAARPLDGVAHRLALPPRPGGRPLRLQSRHDQRHRAGHDEHLDPGAGTGGGRLRLLLRVPDRVDEADQQRRPHRPAGRDRCRSGAGVAVLRVCHVWAPMYRQATISALGNGAAVRPSVIATAYTSLLAGWKDYLAHDNHGRPVVFIGHSQGAAMLIKLLRQEVDPSPALRKRMVAAVILGGNVQVPQGDDVGGSFRNIPTCRSASQTGCVIAYSSFGSAPPSGAFFGRPGQGVSLQSGQTARAGQQVACVNPVTFSGQVGGLQPDFLSATASGRSLGVATPWVSFPGLYTAQCEQSSGASWLQVTTTSVPGDPRPTVQAQGPLWGYHVDDVNLALGNLVADVGAKEAAYR